MEVEYDLSQLPLMPNFEGIIWSLFFEREMASFQILERRLERLFALEASELLR